MNAEEFLDHYMEVNGFYAVIKEMVKRIGLAPVRVEWPEAGRQERLCAENREGEKRRGKR